MAVDTNEIALLLRNGIPAKQADALAAWMLQVQGVLDAVGAADLADILTDISTLQTNTGADHTTLTRLMNGVIQLAAKLDDDATVTDTDYEAVLDATLNPV